MEPFPYTRLVVVGATGSGKSTLAEQLSQKLNLDFVELDALHWRPGWVEAPNEEFRALADEATRAPGWVVAGNYRITRDIIWPRKREYPQLFALPEHQQKRQGDFS